MKKCQDLKDAEEVCNEPEYSCFEPEGVTNMDSMVLFVATIEFSRLYL